jgi:sporulation protein YlmC with PRC-barrel domain
MARLLLVEASVQPVEDTLGKHSKQLSSYSWLHPTSPAGREPMKLVMSLLGSCVFVAGLLLLAPEHVPFPVHTPITAPAPPLAQTRITPVLYAHALLGAPVRTPDGLSLGVVNDLVFDPKDGRIFMVIIVAGGRFSLSGRFIALPWSLVQPAANDTAFGMVLIPATLHFSPRDEGLAEVSD